VHGQVKSRLCPWLIGEMHAHFLNQLLKMPNISTYQRLEKIRSAILEGLFTGFAHYLLCRARRTNPDDAVFEFNFQKYIFHIGHRVAGRWCRAL
jgi:hypothetical protein